MLKKYLTLFLIICILTTYLTGCSGRPAEKGAKYLDYMQDVSDCTKYDGKTVCIVGYRTIEGPYYDYEGNEGLEYFIVNKPLVTSAPLDSATNTLKESMVIYTGEDTMTVIPYDAFPIKIWGTLIIGDWLTSFPYTSWRMAEVSYRRLTYDEMLTVELRTFAKLADKGYITIMHDAYRDLQKHIRYELYGTTETVLKEEIKIRDIEEIKQDILSWDESFDGTLYIELLEYINEVAGWVNYHTKNGNYENNALYDSELRNIEALFKEFQNSGMVSSENVKID